MHAWFLLFTPAKLKINLYNSNVNFGRNGRVERILFNFFIDKDRVVITLVGFASRKRNQQL